MQILFLLSSLQAATQSEPSTIQTLKNKWNCLKNSIREKVEVYKPIVEKHMDCTKKMLNKTKESVKSGVETLKEKYGGISKRITDKYEEIKDKKGKKAIEETKSENEDVKISDKELDEFFRQFQEQLANLPKDFKGITQEELDERISKTREENERNKKEAKKADL